MNYKNDLRKRYFHDIIRCGGIKRHNFLGKTFSTKFFLKFCSDMVEPWFICFQILSYEPENRTKEDIEKASPWLKTLDYFYEFISLKESKEKADLLINKLTWVLNRKKYYANTIIKRAGENSKNFYLILDGNILKLDIVIFREVLSLEEYLVYLIKMKLINEKEIINKCRILNKQFVDINEDSIKNFCKKNNINNYQMLKKIAINELNNFGLNINENFEEEEFNNDDLKYNSIESYIKIFSIQVNAKRQYEKTKAYYNFYIPKYEKNITLVNGYFFGNLLKNGVKENSTYISENISNIAILNKDLNFNDDLYEAINNKKKKIFKENNQKFFIFHQIKEENFLNNYAPFMVYKKYYKGEKIFLQNSCYEGIFLVQSGEIKINVDISLDNMYNLLTYLTFALNVFNDYVSGFTSKDYINDQIKRQDQKIENHQSLDHQTLKFYTEKRNYLLLSIKSFNIFGTNESYDHQTGIYIFNAECVSDEAFVYFLPKENLNFFLNKEKTVYNSLIQLVEFRIKDIIWKIKYYIKMLEKRIEKFKSKKIIKESLHSITDNNKNNIINQEYQIKTNSLKNIAKKNEGNNLHYNFSKSNFIKSNKYRNLLLSKEINNDNFYTFRKTKYKYKLNDTAVVRNLTNEKNRINEYNNKKNNIFSYSQSIKNKTNCISKNFPYLIMDTFIKREISKDSKNEILKLINDSNNIKPIKIKKTLFQ